MLFWFYLYLNIPKNHNDKYTHVTDCVSIIIAFKDEEFNLPLLIKALNSQLGIEKSNIELIFVNDHSEDNSINILANYKGVSEYDLKVLNLERGSGKKQALRLGVTHAKHDLLLFTDADCIPNSKWINQMVLLYISKKSDLLIGTVWYNKPSVLFERLQEMEFAVLQLITAISVNIHWPFMCNGANLMTRKSIYSEYLQSINSDQLLSGDDVFFLDYMIQKRFYIHYANSTSAFVNTRGESKLKDFVNQRLRWSSKIKYYRNLRMIIPSIVFTFWSLFVFLVIPVGYFYSFKVSTIFIFTKLVIDYCMLYKFYKVYNRKNRILDFFILSIIYPIYVFCIGFLSFFKTFTWKDRLARA